MEKITAADWSKAVGNDNDFLIFLCTLSIMEYPIMLFSFSWHLQKYLLFLNQTFFHGVMIHVLVAQLELERPRCQSVNPVLV